MVAPRIGARLDGHETVATFVVGEHATCAREVRIQRRTVIVVLVPVAARGIALPDFNQSVRNREPVVIEHATADDDALPEWIAAMLAGQIAVLRPHIVHAEHRPGDLRQSMRQHDQRPGRRALARGRIRRMQQFRLRAFVRPPVTGKIGHAHRSRCVRVGCRTCSAIVAELARR